MAVGWQEALVFGIVVVAAGWLVRHRARKRLASGCSDCPAGDAKPADEPLIPASSIKRRPRP